MSAAECICFSQMDEKLKPHGAALLCNLFGPPRAIVSTYQLLAEKGKRRKKVPYVLASFCPFCGVKYGRPDAEDQLDSPSARTSSAESASANQSNPERRGTQ